MNAPTGIRQAGGKKLGIGSQRRLVALDERARGGDRFGEAHERDTERAGPQLLSEVKVGHGEGRDTRRDRSDERHAVALEREQADRRNGGRDDHEGRGPAGPQFLDDHESGNGQDACCERCERRVGQIQTDGLDVVKEGALLEVDAEDLGQLIDDDHDADAGLESDQHGLGDEVGDEPEAQNRGHDQDGAHHQRECRRGLEQGGRITIGNDTPELGDCQDRDGRARAHTQHARTAQHGVDDHGHEGRVQAYLDRKTRDSGVRHGFRDDDRRSRQPGDDVGAQPFLAVTADPFEQWQAELHFSPLATITPEGLASWRPGRSPRER